MAERAVWGREADSSNLSTPTKLRPVRPKLVEFCLTDLLSTRFVTGRLVSADRPDTKFAPRSIEQPLRDHRKIDAETYDDLGVHFMPEQSVELG